MEKKKINKISIIILSIVFIILLILTIYKLNKNHEEKLYNVLYSKIEYASYKCYLEEKCDNNFKLKDLYEKKNLETQYDPISKEELDENTKINIKDNKVIINKKK